jgi:hypothetical protein
VLPERDGALDRATSAHPPDPLALRPSDDEVGEDTDEPEGGAHEIVPPSIVEPPSVEHPDFPFDEQFPPTQTNPTAQSPSPAHVVAQACVRESHPRSFKHPSGAAARHSPSSSQ